MKYALRTLRRNPAFTVGCIATLTVGLGATITVLCVVSAFQWKPLPYPEPGRLVALNETDPRNGVWTFSEPSLVDVRERSRTLSAVAAYRRDTLVVTGAGEPESVEAAAVTPSFFEMFGITPVAGTALRDSSRDVVVSRRLWKRKWNMDPRIAGRAIVLNGESYTVAGVADPPGDLLPGVELLFPLTPKATESRTKHEIEAAGRLRAGVGEAQAQAELSSIAAGIGRENPATNAGWGIRATPLADFIAGPNTGRTIWMIFAAVVLLWVLACVNAGGLRMARSVTRRHEMSTRLALGASRGRLLGRTPAESVVLACAGGIFGAALARCAVEGIRRFAMESVPFVAHVQMDAKAVALAIGCMLASTVVFGVSWGRAPAFQQGREISRRDCGRDRLVVVQVELASMSLLGAACCRKAIRGCGPSIRDSIRIGF